MIQYLSEHGSLLKLMVWISQRPTIDPESYFAQPSCWCTSSLVALRFERLGNRCEKWRLQTGESTEVWLVGWTGTGGVHQQTLVLQFSLLIIYFPGSSNSANPWSNGGEYGHSLRGAQFTNLLGGMSLGFHRHSWHWSTDRTQTPSWEYGPYHPEI